MTDIVERLRDAIGRYNSERVEQELFATAADEIERLRNPWQQIEAYVETFDPVLITADGWQEASLAKCHDGVWEWYDSEGKNGFREGYGPTHWMLPNDLP